MSRPAAVPRVIVGLSVATAGMVLLPVIYLAVRVFGDASGNGAAAVWTAQTGWLLVRTILLCLGVGTITLALAATLAWLVVRTDLPGRRVWALLAALPLVFPSYVAAFSFVAFFGPQGFLRDWLGVSALPAAAYGYSGALLTLSLYTYPYTFLLCIAALRQIDPAVEDSSRSLGVGPWGTFFRAVLPQLTPALSAGTLLVVLYTLSDFGAVSIVRFNTFTLAIYNAYRALFDRTVAASLALVLVAITLLLLVLREVLVSRARPTRERPIRRRSPIPLGRWKVPALLTVGGLSVVTLGVPLVNLGYWGLRAVEVGNPLGRTGAAVWNSLGVAAAAGGVAVVLSLPIASWVVHYPSRSGRWVDRAAQTGYALPGLVVALALVFFSTRTAPLLYQTLALLVSAYVVRFLPQALASSKTAMASVASSLQEAGRSLGRRPWFVHRTITMPLIAPGVLAGLGLVFLTTMKELPATLILRPTGFETLATRVWSATSEGIYSQAALPAVWLLLVSAPPVYWLIIRPVLSSGRGA